MRKTLIGMSALALVATLSACGGREEAANNVAAENDMNAMMADAGPFADAEMRMNDALVAAVGVNAGDSWVRKMIEHHKGAVEMSRQVLTMNPDAHVAGMANDIIAKQTREIAALEKLVADGTPDPASAEIYRPAMDQMHNAMMAASGADLSETFHRKMLEHHKGAVALSDVALANGVTGAIRAQVEKTRADQQREVEMVEAMLRGEPAPAAAPAPAPEPAPPAAAEKPAAPRPAPAKPAPAKPRPAEPAADPHAGHDMNNMH
ncbi:MAG: DUF305 domain-containing protein [Sphingomonas sp.]|nr:DUF305 domain-containing protein [Sphingomonas sp.]